MKQLKQFSKNIQIIKLVLTGTNGLPAVSKAEFLNPKDVQSRISPDDPVIGLNINGEARAYPIKWIREQQAVADKVGGKSIIITYCENFKKAAVFIIDSAPRALRKVTVPLQDQNIILYDPNKRQFIEETTGEIIFGPNKGQQLEAVPTRIVPWVTWETSHPDSKVYYQDTVGNLDSADSSNEKVNHRIEQALNRLGSTLVAAKLAA